MPGIAAVVVLGAMAGASLWLSFPPDVPLHKDTGFAIVHADADGGSLWLDIEAGTPIVMADSSERVEIVFEISGGAGVSASLMLGGSLVDADPSCSGVAFDFERVKSTPEDAERDALVAYLQRRPGTGHIFNSAAVASRSRADAERLLEDMWLYVSREVLLVNAVQKTWQSGGESGSSRRGQYELATARVACTFDRSAIVHEHWYRERLRVPDLAVSHANQNGDGLLKVGYAIDVRAVQQMSSLRSTFNESATRVDSSGSVVTTYTDDWWVRNARGEVGAVIAGGTVVWESQGAQHGRNVARLMAGLLAALGIAVGIATVAGAIDRTKWAWQ